MVSNKLDMYIKIITCTLSKYRRFKLAGQGQQRHANKLSPLTAVTFDK